MKKAINMLRHKSTAAATLLFLLFFIQVRSQGPLPRSNPEAQGVSSEGITNFLDAVAASKNEFHSFMFVRHGKVIAEGWWDPYRADLKHTMYSCSKSFTSTAIGFAVKEKKIRVTDKVISFFPGELPDSVSPYLGALTVKDLLTMSVGQDPDPTFIVNKDTNWVKAFLSTPLINKPGSKFLYNSAATYMLSAIVQKVTGQKVIDYLTPRLFEPLGITGIDWETDPKGINTGGWGLRLKTEDMAKFGQLFLKRGKWNRKRIISKSWIKEASNVKIIQHPDYPQSKRDSSDWEQGYSYQMWRSRHNAYRGDGAFGQFILVMPDQDAVIAITSETTDMQDELNLVWKYLLPAMRKKKMKANDSASLELTSQLHSLVLPLPGNSNTSALSTELSGKSFLLQPNDKNIRSVSFDFDNGSCNITFKTDTSEHKIGFALRKWQEGETTKRGPYLVAKAKTNLEGLPPFKVAGEYHWRDENKLELILRYIESPHTETIICQFNEKKIDIEMRNSFSPENVLLVGEME
jgi:CubicO group peptidase (beta-lactamase class C family)